MGSDDDLWDSVGSSREYPAYIARDKPTAGLEIVRANAPSRFPGYPYLLDMSWGRQHYAAFSLFYTFMIVMVKGKNLKEVIDSIKARRCALIQEFRPEDFDVPAAGKPIIRSISIIVKAVPDMIAEGEKTSEPA